MRTPKSSTDSVFELITEITHSKIIPQEINTILKMYNKIIKVYMALLIV